MNAEQKLGSLLQQAYSMTNEELELFMRIVTIRKFKRKTTILEPGQACTCLSIILSGATREFHMKNGKDVSIQFVLDNGFTTNLKSCIDGTPSEFGIETMLDSEIACVKYSELQKLYETTPSFNRVGRMICERYVIVGVDRTYELLGLTAKEKYQKLIKASGDLINQLPQKYIASYLGISPVSLSRMKKELITDRKVTPE